MYCIIALFSYVYPAALMQVHQLVIIVSHILYWGRLASSPGPNFSRKIKIIRNDGRATDRTKREK